MCFAQLWHGNVGEQRRSRGRDPGTAAAQQRIHLGMHGAAELGDVEQPRLPASLADQRDLIGAKPERVHNAPGDLIGNFSSVPLVRIVPLHVIALIGWPRPVESAARRWDIVAPGGHDPHVLTPHHRSDLPRKISGPERRGVREEHRVLIRRRRLVNGPEDKSKEPLELRGRLGMLGLLADVDIGQVERIAGLLAEVVLLARVAIDHLLSLAICEASLLEIPDSLSSGRRQADQEEPGPIHRTQCARFVGMLDGTEDVGGAALDWLLARPPVSDLRDRPEREDLARA